MLTIYHNPRCSKSRETLGILTKQCQLTDQLFNIIEYLKTPLGESGIKGLLHQLNCQPIEMMRVKEPEFYQQNLTGTSDDKLIDAMIHTPKLIERPIVTDGNKAIICRPPEKILTFFSTTDKLSRL